MKRFTLLLAAALLALFAFNARAQFVPVGPGSTKVIPSWGPPPPDASDPSNASKYTARVAYLVKHGFVGAYEVRFIKASPIPGFPEPPAVPYVVFSCNQNPEESIHSYELFLKSPAVTLTELKVHCKFGDPSLLEPFEEFQVGKPSPTSPSAPLPQPANPLGPEIFPGSGKFFAAPGDQSKDGALYGNFVKKVRQTPFGVQSWWEKLP